MPKAQYDQLIILIKSLDKVEKRAFRIYVNRLESNKDGKFIKLFDYIDKSKSPDGLNIKKSFTPALSVSKLSNLKRHLYKEILTSLRLLHSNKDSELMVSEQLDYSKILYKKGLYKQALKILDRAKDQANKFNLVMIGMEIIEFEKLIESRHITRSRKVSNKIEKLLLSSKKIKTKINRVSDLLNIALKIHGLYIKMGHVKSSRDQVFVKDYFEANMIVRINSKSEFYEKIYWHQSYMWYNYTILNFKYCYRHSLAQIELFYKDSEMLAKDPDLFMRAMHYVLLSLFYLKDVKRYDFYNQKFLSFFKEHAPYWNKTSKLIYFIYGRNAVLNSYFLRDDYKGAEKEIKTINEELASFSSMIDQHRKIIFLYKIAWLYFAQKKYNSCIDYLLEIINLKKQQLKREIFLYANLILLLCHYELSHYELVRNKLTNIKRLFDQEEQSNDLITAITDTLRVLSSERRTMNTKEKQKLNNISSKISKDRFNLRSTIFLDAKRWLHNTA